MTNYPARTGRIVDDKNRPWKAICAAVVSALAVLVAQGQDLLPAWAMLVVAALIAGLTTFLVRNPKVSETLD